MIWLWLVFAFLAGVLFWHLIGAWMIRKGLRSDEYRRRILNNLSDEALVKVEKDVSEEIMRRHRVLDERRLKAVP